MRYNTHTTQGFTLIETIVGIVVLSISFTVLTNLIYPLVTHSGDQLHQIRAAELAQSMLNEITNKAFDENSDKSGGRLRCGETGALSCTSHANLNAESGESRSTYDDVDDYNNLYQVDSDIENSLGSSPDDLYEGYIIDVEVCNDGDYDGICFDVDGDSDDKTAKLITVKVTTPLAVTITFSSYRANF